MDLPFYLAPTALQRLFHYDGERAVGKAAKKFNTMFGVSAETPNIVLNFFAAFPTALSPS